MNVTWVLESELMPDVHQRLRAAADAAGQGCTAWDDMRWPDRVKPRGGEFVLFHGSLSIADRVAAAGVWSPGAFCHTAAFHCSAWYEGAAEFLLHRRWVLTTVRDLVERSEAVMAEASASRAAFVRPDSPLKPFSGRVVEAGNVTAAALDHGFYYDDLDLPVVVAPVRAVVREWRYVVANGRVVAGSAYLADGRAALPDTPDGAPWTFAAHVAKHIDPPDPLYVLDICECDGRLWLLELNPFSGADLYACDADAIVGAVAELAARWEG